VSILLHDSGVSFKQFNQFNAAHTIPHYNLVIPTESAEDEQRRVNTLVETLNNARDNFQIGRLLTASDHPSKSSTSHKEPVMLALLPPTSTSDGTTGSGASSGLTSGSGVSPELTVPNSTSQPNAYFNSVFKLDINRFRKNACKAFCSCRQRRTKRGILGRSTLGYSSPMLRRVLRKSQQVSRHNNIPISRMIFPPRHFINIRN
jgi:hypothetical protein